MEIKSLNITPWEKALDGLSIEQRAEVERHLKNKTYQGGSQVFRQGEPADAIFILSTGQLRLFCMNDEGEEYTIGVWKKGYVFGLISSILECHRLLSAECMSETFIQVLSRKDLLKLMEVIPRFSFNIVHIVARLAMDSIVDSGPLALEPASVRLGKILLRLAVPDQPDFPHAQHCVRGVTQESLAKMVGVSRPWVSAILSSFENGGLIQRKRRAIVLADRSKLPQSWL